MKNRFLFRLLVGTGVAATLTGCAVVTSNPQDSTPPTVVIEVQSATDNQYHVQSSVPYLGSPINVKADANDPQGMKEVRLEYVTGLVSSCTDANGAVWNGTFPVVNLPPPQQIIEPAGKVPTELTLPATITGPFRCSLSVIGHGLGTFSGTVKLRATAFNWSSNLQAGGASTDLAIQVQA